MMKFVTLTGLLMSQFLHRRNAGIVLGMGVPTEREVQPIGSSNGEGTYVDVGL
jgi:hypothetical protein